MVRYTPLIVGILIVIGTGVAHGLLSDRWKFSNEPEASAEKLQRVAMNVGDWEGKDLPGLDAHDLAIGEITGFLSRTYINRLSGNGVTVLIVCGRPGPIGVHTPDVCFVGAGNELTKKDKRTIDPPVLPMSIQCFIGQFKETAVDANRFTRAFWTWSSNGEWKAPTNPRWTFARVPALYKLYVTRVLASENEPIDEDPTLDFLKTFLPELQKTLFSGS